MPGPRSRCSTDPHGRVRDHTPRWPATKHLAPPDGIPSPSNPPNRFARFVSGVGSVLFSPRWRIRGPAGRRRGAVERHFGVSTESTDPTGSDRWPRQRSRARITSRRPVSGTSPRSAGSAKPRFNRPAWPRSGPSAAAPAANHLVPPDGIPSPANSPNRFARFGSGGGSALLMSRGGGFPDPRGRYSGDIEGITGATGSADPTVGAAREPNRADPMSVRNIAPPCSGGEALAP